MQLIIDSGGTKADFALIRNEKVIELGEMDGFNPTISQGIVLEKTISKNNLIQQHFGSIEKVIFYGAGMAKPANIKLVGNILGDLFVNADIELYEDMLGAIHAANMISTGDKIVGILGTGCNLSLVRGNVTTPAGVSLGFILGDEGSGAYIGKKVLTAALREKLDNHFLKALHEYLGINSKADIVTTLYKHPKPNRFLGSLSKLVNVHIGIESVRELVEDSFQDFVDHKLSIFRDYQSLPIYFVGSVAKHFEEILKEILLRNNYNFNQVIHRPIELLVKYQLKTINKT